jgi:hypothetical protein
LEILDASVAEMTEGEAVGDDGDDEAVTCSGAAAAPAAAGDGDG